MSRSKLSFFSFIFFFSLSANAQTWEVGASVGGAGYIGDLNPTNLLKISGVHFGAFVKRNIDGYLGVSANYNYGHVEAFDSHSPYEQHRMRNLSFTSSLHEASMLIEFNFLDYFSGGGPRKLSPYVFAGGGVVLFNPKAEYLGETLELAPLHTEGQNESYKRLALTVPYGAGVRYNIHKSMTVFSQIGYRQAYTDYLDDASGRYPDLSNVPDRGKPLSDRSGEIPGSYIGAAGTQRGDFRKRDTYMFVGIGITYTFVSSKCY